MVIKVKIEKTSGYIFDHTASVFKEFDKLESAPDYCWDLIGEKDKYIKTEIIVTKPYDFDIETDKFKNLDYDYELEIYNDYRE